MATIGSGISGSIAATPLGSEARARQSQSEQTEEAAQSKELRRLSDMQQHAVEDTEQVELNGIRPDERRQRRRRRLDGQEADDLEPTDRLELESKPPDPGQAERTVPAAPGAPPPDAGRILDVEA